MRKYVVIMLLLGVSEIALALYLTYWRASFWTYVVAKNYLMFGQSLVIFTLVALSLCVITASATYAGSLAAIQWRKKLNEKALSKKNLKIENVSQRIQQDCSEYPTLVITIGWGLVKAIMYVLVFSISLIHEFSYIYLLIIAAYAILSTYIAKKIGNPLVSLNYQSQQIEATYRNTLEEPDFKGCLKLMLSLATKLKHLQYFQSLYGQLGIIIPLLIIAPAYFTGGMLIGGLMQARSLMETIGDNLSYGINSFDIINRLLSSRKRLKEMGVL